MELKDNTIKELTSLNLKDARINSGYSQSEIGEKVGIHRNQIAKWEKGHLAKELNNIINKYYKFFEACK